MLTEIGPVEIEVPRDRDGSFEPVIVPKRKRRLDGIDEIALSLSARGLTTGEIAAQPRYTTMRDATHHVVRVVDVYGLARCSVVQLNVRPLALARADLI